jgi:hypothetical protein
LSPLLCRQARDGSLRPLSFRTARRPASKRDRCLAMLSWFTRFPAIPHRECPFVACPREILLSDATSALSIKKGRALHTGVPAQVSPPRHSFETRRPNYLPRPFPVGVSSRLHVKFLRTLFGVVSGENDGLSGAIVRLIWLTGVFWHHVFRHPGAKPAAGRERQSREDNCYRR